jgi:S-(hydroxymethyl)glutathione dehydrogenase / alcohol dehydrogenase
MRAAVLSGPGRLEVVDDVELEPPRSGEVRVRVAACGICHSDLSLVEGRFPLMGPTVPGHEAAGVVVEVGTGVLGLAVGDHVVCSPAPACGRCPSCRRGRHSICDDSMSIATAAFPDGSTRLSRHGGTLYRGLNLGAWAEEVVVPAAGAVRIDPSLPLDVACVIGCAVQTGVGAVVNTADVVPGDVVVVLGAGGVGVSIVQGAVLAGASQVIVSDPSAERRELARRLGATHAVDPAVDDVVAEVMRRTEGGADWAFDAVGSAALVETGLAAVRSGGGVVLVGAPPADEVASVNVALTMFTEKRLLGSLLGSCHAPRDIPRLTSLWAAGRLDLDAMVTARHPLDDIDEAVRAASAGAGLRTVLTLGA